MPNRLNLSITRSNLLRLKEGLGFAQEGHEFLEQKREVLVMEVMTLLKDLRLLKEETGQTLAKAYRAYERARLVLGTKGISSASLAISSQEEIQIQNRNIMGVIISRVKYSQPEKSGLTYGFSGTSAELDKAVHYFSSALEKLAKLAEIEASLRRLATELKKTQARANALNHLFIPEFKETIKYLEDSLEEKGREEFFQCKRGKQNHAPIVEKAEVHR